MNALCIVELGLENACLKELSSQNIKGNAGAGRVSFQASEREIAKFTYVNQSCNRVILLLCDFNASSLQKAIKSINTKLPCARKKGSLRVDCERHGDHDYAAMDLEAEAGASLIEKGYGLNASMKDPDIVYYLYVRQDKGFLGIDVCHKDLGKRAYKLFSGASTIRGPLAYGLLSLARFNQGMSVLDPFCGAGTIPIEAALKSTGTSPNHYDKTFYFSKDYSGMFESLDGKRREIQTIACSDKELRHVNNVRKNAKIAGVDKSLRISKCDVEWVDTKFGEKSMDLICTHPPQPSKRTSISELKKVYKELFYQAAYVLKPKGRIALLLTDPSLVEECSGDFKVVERQIIYSGLQPFVALVLSR